jgi:predicted transcriptional regulator
MTVYGMAAVRAAIKRELRADGCTQEDLADYLGVSQAHVSRALGGKYRLQFGAAQLPFVEAMAAAVGIGPDDISQLYTGGTA